MTSSHDRLPACWLDDHEEPLFLPAIVCVSVCNDHIYHLALDDFDQTWMSGP